MTTWLKIKKHISNQNSGWYYKGKLTVHFLSSISHFYYLPFRFVLTHRQVRGQVTPMHQEFLLRFRQCTWVLHSSPRSPAKNGPKMGQIPQLRRQPDRAMAYWIGLWDGTGLTAGNSNRGWYNEATINSYESISNKKQIHRFSQQH